MVGGDLLEARWSHPTRGSGVVFGKANEDVTYNLGGYVSADDMSGVDGGGRVIDVMNRERWKVSFTISWDMTGEDELQKMQALQSDPVPATWTFDHISGSIRTGKGKPVGAIPGSGKATIPLVISGGGVLSKV